MPARLVGALLLCAGAALSGCGPAERTGAVLVTVDTLRADHVGVLSNGTGRTPWIDALAREGTLFERAISPLPLTRPSHFSMLTGLHPREHGVLSNQTALPDAATSLPEVLRAHGWRTAAFTAARVLGPDSGATQGFERFEATGRRLERSGAEVVEHALAWLDGLGAHEPFFLWVHLFEPHQPYAPPPGFRQGLQPEQAAAYPSLAWEDFHAIASARDGDVPEAVLEHARRLYRGEVSAADQLVGRLLDGVAARTPLDRVLVLLTADHGECFENGVWFEHADCLYEGALHVPLIVRHPPDFPADTRVTHPVGLVDVAPTVLRAAGLPALDSVAGRPLQDSAGFGDRHILVQYPFYTERTLDLRRKRFSAVRSVGGRPVRDVVTASPWVGLVGPHWKFLTREGVEELYPLTPRADESENLVRAKPEVAAELRRLLAAELAAHPLTELEPGKISYELQRALEALGYVQ